MRREGYEFQVSTPHVLFHTGENGEKLEPVERVLIDVPEGAVGSVMEKLGARKAELVHMAPSGSRMRLEFLIPSRGLFGYRSEFLTDTKGEGIMNAVFDSYQPYKGEIPTRHVGSLIAFETGEAVTYGLYNAQERRAPRCMKAWWWAPTRRGTTWRSMSARRSMSPTCGPPVPMRPCG